MAYIKKEDATNEVLTLRDYSVNNEEKFAFSLVYRKLRELPTAEVAEVKHSEWILHSDGSGTCKICGKHQKHVWDMDNWQNFCGNCGAKMDGGKAE